MDISVVIATRNQASLLERTLAGIAGQKVEGLRWELVVVDNGSEDRTLDVLEAASTPVPPVVLDEPVPGKNRALNRALGAARGRWLVLTDDDVVVEPSWLQELWNASRRWPDARIFGGPVHPHWPEATPAWIRSPDFFFASQAFSRYVPADEEGPVSAAPFGNNLMLEARLLADDRFDEGFGPVEGGYRMGGETELLMRLAARGERFVYAPRAAVRHVVRPEQVTEQWLYRRAFRYGRSRAHLHERRGRRAFGVPPRFWRRLAASGLRHALGHLAGERARIGTGIVFHKRRGLVRELRQMARESAAGA